VRDRSATPHNFACEIGPRRRPEGEAKGLSHKAACEDEGLMAVFQQPLSRDQFLTVMASHTPPRQKMRLAPQAATTGGNTPLLPYESSMALITK